MPNWCLNELTIEGPAEVQIRFIREQTIRLIDEEGLEGDPQITFTKILPIPVALANTYTGGCDIDGERVSIWREIDGVKIAISEEELAELREKYGAAGLHDWCTHNWDTKWDTTDGWMQRQIDITGPRRVSVGFVSFTTAWSPPLNVIRAWGEAYPELRFALVYKESGMGFKGHFFVDHGEVESQGDCAWVACYYCDGDCVEDMDKCAAYLADEDNIYTEKPEEPKKQKEPALRGGELPEEDE